MQNNRPAEVVSSVRPHSSRRTTPADEDGDGRRENTGLSGPRHPRTERTVEMDTTEDPTDGMGAIKFTDEEDWAFFGQ